MRFITEFEIDGTQWDLTPAIISHRKELSQAKIGSMIAESFGWQEKGKTTPSPNSSVFHINELEIEAFPMDKWVEFKKALLEILETPPGDDHARDAFQLISKLESFSKKENNEK